VSRGGTVADLHTIHQIQQVLPRSLNDIGDADDGLMQVLQLSPFALPGLVPLCLLCTTSAEPP
jgi:hypothetical protein